MEIGQPFTQGNWHVKQGQEDEFIGRWTEFVEWAAKNSEGADRFILIRSVGDPGRFVSFASWSGQEAVDGWRNTPEFAHHLGRCRELCHEFSPNDSTLAAFVEAT